MRCLYDDIGIRKKVSILLQMRQNLLWLMLFGSILKIPYHTGSVQTIREHMQLKFEYPRKVNANCYACKLFQFFQLLYLHKSKYHVCIIPIVLRGLNSKMFSFWSNFYFQILTIVDIKNYFKNPNVCNLLYI